jgi:hypothetical protein
MIYWWAFFDSALPITVVEAQAVQRLFRYGEPIAVEELLDVHRVCPGTVSRAVVDGAGIAYPLLLAPDPLIGEDTKRIRIEFRLPSILGPGNYRYREVAHWRCNAISDLDQVLVDVPFTVVRWQR